MPRCLSTYPAGKVDDPNRKSPFLQEREGCYSQHQSGEYKASKHFTHTEALEQCWQQEKETPSHLLPTLRVTTEFQLLSTLKQQQSFTVTPFKSQYLWSCEMCLISGHY